MRVRPVLLNTSVAWSFLAGSTCFVVGSVPAYVDAVGGWWAAVTLPGTLFFNVSTFGILALDGSRGLPRRIAWLNMVGSVLPTGDLVSTRVSVAGTLLGALCFLVGAALLVPAWRESVAKAGGRASGSLRSGSPMTSQSHMRSHREERS